MPTLQPPPPSAARLLREPAAPLSRSERGSVRGNRGVTSPLVRSGSLRDRAAGIGDGRLRGRSGGTCASLKKRGWPPAASHPPANPALRLHRAPCRSDGSCAGRLVIPAASGIIPSFPILCANPERRNSLTRRARRTDEGARSFGAPSAPLCFPLRSPREPLSLSAHGNHGDGIKPIGSPDARSGEPSTAFASGGSARFPDAGLRIGPRMDPAASIKANGAPGVRRPRWVDPPPLSCAASSARRSRRG
jgi:hypothetical protein